MGKKKIRTRRRRKGGHYKTGLFESVKCKEIIKYRSGWELICANYLDLDPLVKSYSYEELRIPYISNISKNKIRNYIPDFLVEYVDGRKIIIEVKRKSSLNNLLVIKKAMAAKSWGKKRNIEYVFWTEDVIKRINDVLKENDIII
jgi:TnsA-like endonuclease N terminal